MTLSLQDIDSPDQVGWLHPGAENPHHIEWITNTIQEISQRFATTAREYMKAIYLHQEVIGFTAFYPTELVGDQVWLIHTFMIDHHFQGRGYGKQAFELLLNHIHSLNSHRLPIELSSNNPLALNLYKRFGFREPCPDRSSKYREKVIDETLLRYTS